MAGLKTWNVGDLVWYLYRLPGSVMQEQERATILAVTDWRVKIQVRGRRRPIWVLRRNLRPTN